MFCPQCQTEYQPHVRRCSDCDVPLVARVPATHRNHHRTRLFGFVLFKELGVFIVIPVTVFSTILVFIGLRTIPFSAQIAAMVGYTGGVFFFVFCDAGSRGGKGTKGFSLGEPAVRQRLPLLACVHLGFLLIIFPGVTGAMWLRSHARFFAQLDTDYFFFLSLCIGTAIGAAQVYFFRGLLQRALDAQRSGNS
jgi:hypothetical protein